MPKLREYTDFLVITSTFDISVSARDLDRITTMRNGDVIELGYIAHNEIGHCSLRKDAGILFARRLDGDGEGDWQEVEYFAVCQVRQVTYTVKEYQKDLKTQKN